MYYRELSNQTNFSSKSIFVVCSLLVFIFLVLEVSECASPSAIISSQSMRLDLDLLAENLPHREVRSRETIGVDRFDRLEFLGSEILVSCVLHSRSGNQSNTMDKYSNHSAMFDLFSSFVLKRFLLR